MLGIWTQPLDMKGAVGTDLGVLLLGFWYESSVGIRELEVLDY